MHCSEMPSALWILASSNADGSCVETVGHRGGGGVDKVEGGMVDDTCSGIEVGVVETGWGVEGGGVGVVVGAGAIVAILQFFLSISACIIHTYVIIQVWQSCALL